ncbi:MAG: glycosyltransferase [Lachnospiraceae bacterium]|nr:glycosyltransferase [Lachnospiraceae bacterium]
MLSVIVPVYNVEAYLPKCIESITAQTYEQLEIILIDDGSTDRCPWICDKYAEKDKRIKVFHKENRGLVSARKTGLYIAKGDYITFVDGDDWIDREMYGELMKTVENSRADFVDSGYICEREQKKEIYGKAEAKEYQFDKQIRHRFFSSLLELDDFISISPSIWSKIFKAEFIRNTYAEVPEHMSYGEDVINLLYCILRADRMARAEGVYYHYNYRENSMSHLKSASHVKKESVLWNYCGTIILENDSLMEQRDIDRALLKKLYSAFEFTADSGFDAIQYYIFPNIEELFDKKILLYGAGRVGKDYLTQISKYERCEIAGWTDRDFEKMHVPYRKVLSIEASLKKAYDIVLIAVEKEETAEEIRNSLLGLHVPEEKLLWCKPDVLGA